MSGSVARAVRRERSRCLAVCRDVSARAEMAPSILAFLHGDETHKHAAQLEMGRIAAASEIMRRIVEGEGS